MAKFRVETQLAIDKKSTKDAKDGMEVLTGTALKLFAVIGGAKLMTAPIKAYIGMIEDSIAASEKATAAQDRMHLAIKNVYKTIGDEMAPGLNELATSIQQALANPEVIKGLESMGRLLALVAGGVARTATEIADFVGSPEFSKWLQFFSGVDLNSDAAVAYREHGALVDDIVNTVSKWAKGVGEQQKAEDKAAEARKRAHETHLKALQAILDKVNPIAKAERETWEQILTLNQALKAGEIDVTKYQEALAFLTSELNRVKEAGQLAAQTIATIDIGPRDLPATNERPTGGYMTVSQSPYVEEMMRAEEQFSANLTEGMGQAAASFAREFIETGELNVQRLGDMLVDVLLNAAQQYFAQMVANQAKLESTSGTGGGANAGAAMGFAAAFLLVAKAIADNGNAKKAKSYDEGAFFSRYYTGGMSGGNIRSDYTFRDADLEAGNTHDQTQMVQTVRAYLEAFREVTGNVVTDIGEFAIEIRHDGEAFRTTYAGVVLGEFETIADATLAGIRAAFTAGDFTGALSPLFEQMLTNFKGSAEDLLAGFEFVKGLEADLSGLSEIETAIQGLPGKTAQLSTKLQELGISMDDSKVIAAQWAATQYQSLRDQITGHQQSEAEQLAQRQREAAMFNAQLALDEAKIRAEMANLQNQAVIEQAKVDVAQAGAQAQLEIINATLAAYGQVLAAIQSVAPIDIGEIRLPGGGGRSRGGARASSGPSEAEQRATAFLAFLEQLRLDGLSGYQRALADMNAAFAEHAEAASEMEGGEERLAAARRQALADLREDVIDAFGSPMEGLRDRLAEIRQRVEDWYAANDALGDQFLAGEISLQQLMAALAESNQLWAEFGDMARGELLNLALYFTDALGNTEESARIREELAEMEWDFNRLQMQMLIETYEEIGWITAAAADHWRGVLDAIPENRPGNINDSTAGGSGSLQQAINRLRSAIDGLRKSNENLLLSDVSPLSTADQFAEAQRRYNETLALAQSGDIGAIEDFAAVRDEYLALAAAMYGTAGDGYQSIFQQSLQAGRDLATAGQAILDAIPPQMAGVEDRLDTIAEIQAAILAAMLPTTNPTGNAGDPPGPPGHYPPPGGPPRPGEDDYYPPGRPPGGPPRPGDSQGFAGGETVSELRAMNEQLRMLLAATEEQTRSANSNSLRRVATTGGSRGISVRRGN